MYELSRIIGEFGDVALSIDCPIEEGLHFPIKPDLHEQAKGRLKSAEDFNALKKLLKLGEEINEEASKHNVSHAPVIGARLFGHDFINLCTPLHTTYEVLQKYGDKGLNELKINRNLIALVNMRQFSLTMAYLASYGDSRFLSRIPVSQIPHLLEPLTHELNFEVDAENLDAILTPEYVAAYQMIKNAKRQITNKKVGSSIKLSLTTKQFAGMPYSVITVEDNSTGILDNEGNPVPAEGLAAILCGQSTTGSGVGLQAARHIVELRKGNLEILTKTEKNQLPIYFSLSNNLRTYDKQLEAPTGTRFTITVPKTKTHHEAIYEDLFRIEPI